MDNNFSSIIPDSLRESIESITKPQKELISNVPKIEFNIKINPVFEQLSRIAQTNISQFKIEPLINTEVRNNLESISRNFTLNHADTLSELSKSFEKFDFSTLLHNYESLYSEVSEKDLNEILNSENITEDDIVYELQAQISGVENKAISEKSEKFKRVIKFIVTNLLIIILPILMNPVDGAIRNKITEELKISEFWQKTGVVDWIEDLFENDYSAVSEEEAKASIEMPESTNVSKGKREDLLNKIAEIRTFIAKSEQDENTAQLMAYLGDLEKDVNGNKYGLVFEEHREAIDEVLENYTPVLTEDEDLFIDNGGNVNFLIEGDNLASLKLLEKTHKGKIDLIYIDPPYNTGKKDFVYSDKCLDVNDGFIHSKWSSFISKRLSIAKNLLSNNGVIFISIDDNEQASLKLICDSVFGVNNFVGLIAVENNPKGRKNSSFISVSNDYLLIYAKDNTKSYFVENIPKDRKDLAQDEFGNFVHNSGKRVLVGENDFNNNVVDFNSSKHYTVYYNSTTCDMILKKETAIDDCDEELIGKGYVRYYSYNINGFVENTYTEERIKDLFKNGALDFKNHKIYEKNFSTNIRAKSIWTNRKYIAVVNNQEVEYALDYKTTSAKQDLKRIFDTDKEVFSNPKNIGLLKTIITLFDKKDIIILDFFAGSGTTGHAVMKLNAEDSGNRKFIICTNNENNICRDITYERIKRVIDKEDYQASLKYYQVQYIPIEEKMYYEYADSLLLHIRELVELENGINFNGNAEIAIVLTDEELEEFIGGIDENNKCRKLYMGHDLLPDEEQDRILKDNEIEICIIPDYYYRDLQER